jgi:hypothetical protein
VVGRAWKLQEVHIRKETGRIFGSGKKITSNSWIPLRDALPFSSAKKTMSFSPAGGLVWIHGGGVEYGSSDLYNGSSLVNFWRSQQSPALLVTINYRLNIFGSMALQVFEI